MGNLRESVEARERKNTGIVAGYIQTSQMRSHSDAIQTCLMGIEYKCSDKALASLLQNLHGFWC